MIAIPQLDYKQATKAIAALKEYINRDSEDSLLGESDRGLWLEIQLAKMTDSNKERHDFISLPHCILPEEAEVCLLVIDSAKEYQQKIDELKFDRKIKVLTAKAFRDKYTRYEAKRQVAREFGLFLVDASLANKINSLFGESFKKVNKAPGVINVSEDKKMLNDDQLKENINKAINSIIVSNNASDSKMAKFGRMEMSEKELVANFKIAYEELKKPLEWKYVQSVSISSDNSIALPIYACVPGVWLLDDQVIEEVAAPEITPKQEESLKKAAKKSNKKSKATPKKDQEVAPLKAKTEKSITKKPVASKAKKTRATK